ncbi:MAG: CHC2 zinc finger domain-containing protein [Dehalococcoidia bacterium]
MHDLHAIRAAHPIAATIQSAGVELRQRGRRFVAQCPFHRDTAPSLTVYPDTASWYCYGCEIGGDVFEFVRRIRGLSFKEAADALAGGSGALPANVTPLRQRTPRALSAGDLEIIEAAVAFYEQTLTTFPDVRAYITRRGVSLDTARALRLGYAGRGLTEHLHRSGFNLASAQRLGLVKWDQGAWREPFAGRVIVPNLDRARRATWFTGRAVLQRRLRYLNVEAPSPLLGLAHARRFGHRAVVVVEGPFDWLTACEWRVPAVALVGTHLSPADLEVLAPFDRVYLALDPDEAGRRATAAIEPQLGNRAVAVGLPRGVHDLNELGQIDGGRDAFLRALADARARNGVPLHSDAAPAARAA